MSVSPLSRSLRKSLLPVNPFVFFYPLGRGGWASTLFLFLLVFHWVINWKGVPMRKLLKRFAAAASAVVICGVTCVTSWFSVPVSAVGVFSPFNFYQLYQMLHGLLLGDGGGNSQTFGEWLEKNMTRTVGSGNSKQEFLITPGMKLSDMMDEASMRLMLGAACSDGGFAGISKMKDLVDSWTEVYDTSDIGEIGESGSVSDSDFYSVLDSGVPRLYFSSPYTLYLNGSFRDDCAIVDWNSLAFLSDAVGYPIFLYFCTSDRSLYFIFEVPDYLCIRNSIGVNKQYVTVNFNSTAQFSCSSTKYIYGCSTGDFAQSGLSILAAHGIDVPNSDLKPYQFTLDNVYGAILANPDDFVGPVYAMPAAKQLITDTGTLSGLRLDVQTEDGTPDISAALDHAGVESVDDLVSGVAAGTIPMSQVYEDMRVVPYVLTDVETGQVVTDLNVSSTDAKTKAVALDKTLSIPKDVSAVDAYQVTGKTWDPSLSKYKLPLFNFFPFCLPWDIYQVLSAFAADPVAPSITVPVGKFFSGKKSFDGSAAADITATIDLGDDKFSKWFVMLRALESAGIVIGLVLVSVKLIHGGR